MTYLDVKLEIDKIKGLYALNKDFEEARDVYDKYVSLIIIDSDLSKLEKDTLFDSWEDIKSRIIEES